jgi:hypothetical protein
MGVKGEIPWYYVKGAEMGDKCIKIVCTRRESQCYCQEGKCPAHRAADDSGGCYLIELRPLGDIKRGTELIIIKKGG